MFRAPRTLQWSMSTGRLLRNRNVSTKRVQRRNARNYVHGAAGPLNATQPEVIRLPKGSQNQKQRQGNNADDSRPKDAPQQSLDPTHLLNRLIRPSCAIPWSSCPSLAAPAYPHSRPVPACLCLSRAQGLRLRVQKLHPRPPYVVIRFDHVRFKIYSCRVSQCISISVS